MAQKLKFLIQKKALRVFVYNFFYKFCITDDVMIRVDDESGKIWKSC